MVTDLCPTGPASPQDEAKSRQLLLAALLTATVMAAEIVGGWWTGSLALLSDAGHVFGDVASLLLSFAALRLALRPPTSRHTYGLHRGEIFAALLNAVALLGIAALIFREAGERWTQPPTVHTGPMLAVALVGLVVNAVVALRLRGHGHGDLNLRSAYLHVLGDLLASVAVIVAALVMLATGWYLADPLLSVLIGLLILGGGLRVGYEALHILMEGVPAGMSLEAVAEAVTALPGVQSVHALHAWSLCSNLHAVSLHVVGDYTSEAERVALRNAAEDLLRERFGFAQATIETECGSVCPDERLVRPLAHAPTPEHHHDHDHS